MIHEHERLTARKGDSACTVRKCETCDTLSDPMPAERARYRFRCDACKARSLREKEARRDRVRPNIETPTVAERQCTRCGIVKPADAFQRCRTLAGGLRPSCKACTPKRPRVKPPGSRVAEYEKARAKRAPAAAERRARMERRRQRLKAIERHREREARRRRDAERQVLADSQPWRASGLTGAERRALRYRLDPAEALWSRQWHRLKKQLIRRGVSLRDVGFTFEQLMPLPRQEYFEALSQKAAECGFSEVTEAFFYHRLNLDECGGPCEAGIRRMLSMDNIEVRPWLLPGLSKADQRKARASVDEAFRVRERLAERLRSRNRGKAKEISKSVRLSLRNGVEHKPTFTMLGYTAESLRRHIERQFKKGMTWAAFLDGKIHIDHRRPLASFDLTNPDELRQAWALTNLQPLWASDNIKKGADRSLLL